MAEIQPREWGDKWSKIVAKAWADENFKKRLIKDPMTVLQEQGVGLKQGVQVRVVESTDQVLYLTLPPKSQTEELSETALEAIAGGAYMHGSTGVMNLR
jgi:hypothetical protein